MSTDIKRLKSRSIQKHDVEANWLQATGFVPYAGEIIVYDKDEAHDYVRFKIGDGNSNVNDLPFEVEKDLFEFKKNLYLYEIPAGAYVRINADVDKECLATVTAYNDPTDETNQFEKKCKINQWFSLDEFISYSYTEARFEYITDEETGDSIDFTINLKINNYALRDKVYTKAQADSRHNALKAEHEELAAAHEELAAEFLKKTKIIDVDVLPTEGVNDTCLYRIKTFNGTFFYTYNGKLEPNDRFVLHFVDVLPIVGVVGRLYYQKSDGKHYAYSGAEGKWYENTFPVVYSRAEVDAVDDYGAYLVENMDVKLYVPDTSNPYQIKWVALTNEADALITVDTLPESGGKDGYIYRIQKAYGAYWVIEHTGGIDDGEVVAPATLHYVDALPEVGLPFGGSVPLNIYKPKGDNGYYSYQNGEWDQIHRLFGIAQSYEEIKDSNFYIGFIPESTECKLYTYDNANPFKPKWVELTCGGGSIITVDSLPESDIDPESIYRLSNEFATVYVKGADGSISTNEFNGLPVKVYIVDELPIAGELFIDNADAPTRGVAYYCKADKELYLYAGEWFKFSDEIGAWQEVDSIDGVTTEGIAYICLNTNKGLFYYNNGWHELVDKAELDGKLDKVTDPSVYVRVYGVDEFGVNTMHNVSWGTQANTIAMRGTGGTLKVGAPAEQRDAIPLSYANEHYVQVQGGTGGNRLYGISPNGVQQIFAAAVTNYAWSVPLRNDNFTFTVGEPTENAHPATKKYVDNKFDSLFDNSVIYIFDCNNIGEPE